MKNSISMGSAILFAAAVPLLAIAQGSAGSIEDLRACRAITVPAERLACYDALAARRLGEPATTGSRPTGPVASPTPTAATPVPVPATTSTFGLEERRPADRIEMIEARVVGVLDGWSAGSPIQLDNGQVWAVEDSARSFRGMDRPRVRIRRGLLGSYFLEVEGLSISPRVRRLK